MLFKDFFSTDTDFGFTKIVMNAEPKKLTQDLYISERAPLRILNAQFINLYSTIYYLILLIGISFVSAYLAIRFFVSSPQTKMNLVGLGVANCFTLIGTIIGSRIFLREKRFKFVVFSSLLFVVLTIFILFLLTLLYK